MKEDDINNEKDMGVTENSDAQISSNSLGQIGESVFAEPNRIATTQWVRSNFFEYKKTTSPPNTLKGITKSELNTHYSVSQSTLSGMYNNQLVRQDLIFGVSLVWWATRFEIILDMDISQNRNLIVVGSSFTHNAPYTKLKLEYPNGNFENNFFKFTSFETIDNMENWSYHQTSNNRNNPIMKDVYILYASDLVTITHAHFFTSQNTGLSENIESIIISKPNSPHIFELSNPHSRFKLFMSPSNIFIVYQFIKNGYTGVSTVNIYSYSWFNNNVQLLGSGITNFSYSQIVGAFANSTYYLFLYNIGNAMANIRLLSDMNNPITINLTNLINTTETVVKINSIQSSNVTNYLRLVCESSHGNTITVAINMQGSGIPTLTNPYNGLWKSANTYRPSKIMEYFHYDVTMTINGSSMLIEVYNMNLQQHVTSKTISNLVVNAGLSYVKSIIHNNLLIISNISGTIDGVDFKDLISLSILTLEPKKSFV